jgi:hypothetical protein
MSSFSSSFGERDSETSSHSMILSWDTVFAEFISDGALSELWQENWMNSFDWTEETMLKDEHWFRFPICFSE